MQQFRLGYLYIMRYRLYHIVDGQCRYTASHQRLHFDPSFMRHRAGTLDLYRITAIPMNINMDVLNR